MSEFDQYMQKSLGECLAEAEIVLEAESERGSDRVIINPEGDNFPLGRAIRRKLLNKIEPAKKSHGYKLTEYIKEFRAFIEDLQLRNFRWWELLVRTDAVHKGAENTKPPAQLWDNITDTLLALDEIRTALDAPVYITSSYRNSAYNEAIGGVDDSKHIDFNALDWYCEDWDVDEWANTAREVMERRSVKGGIGRYYDKGFVHIDTRGNWAEWSDD